MKDQILIIGDIAGRYNELQKLLELATKKFGEYSVIGVGDLVDRGSDSDKVVEHFMSMPDTYATRGNHEDMMIDYLKAYDLGETPEYNKAYGWGVWLGNGGKATLRSYADTDGDVSVPPKHFDYLNGLPLFIEHEDDHGKIIITHAPIHPVFGLEKLKEMPAIHNFSLCWNRGTCRRIPGIDMQFHGHNAIRNVQFFSDKLGSFAVDVDTSRGEILTGMLWPTMEIVQVPYEDL